ncbi:MAG TPA: diguanylate cyclase [Desulfobacteraceae bacterium]|nr:diguanylate cyclase [Desulfobacteraceae bacterium]
MQIAFPVQENKGLESQVYGHFGSAPVFVIVDTDNNSVRTINNNDLGHDHGRCQPMKALGGSIVNAVAVGGIGGGALQGMNDLGIKVFRAVEGSIADNLELIKTGRCPEFLMNMTCAGHSHNGGCHH